jgi:hypothetical protein
MKNKQLEKMLRLADIKKKPINEGSKSSSIEFIKSVADGNTYAIFRENRTYYIKSTETKDVLVEGDFDYLNGLKNRTKDSFRGYDDAVTKLNLIFNDINRVQNLNEEVDMVNFDYKLNENGEYVKLSSLHEKKFVLKQPKPKTKPQPEPKMDFDDEEGGDFDFGDESEGEEGGDTDFDFGDEEGGDTEGDEDFDFGDEEGGDTEEGGDFDFGDEEGGDTDMEFDTSEEGGDNIKDIQRTTGKLGQQLRDTEDVSSDMQKWVAKSVISALNLNNMDGADIDDIVNTLENGGGSDEETDGADIDFMDDDYHTGEYGEELLLDDEEEDEKPGGYLGDIALQSNEIDYMDDEDEGPGGYLGFESTSYMDDNNEAERQADKDISSHYNKPSFDELKRGHKLPYDTFDDEREMEEGMSNFMKDDTEGGMGWDTNESVSYMGDKLSDEDIDKLFDKSNNSTDIYGMNNPKEAPTRPSVRPGTGRPDTDRPSRPSKNPFTPPSRIRPGEEPRPKARRRDRVDYMSQPSPSRDPSEAPTTTPTKPGTDRPVRPSKNPFTPPSRIRPGEEPRPKARRDGGINYMDDSDVDFS